MKVKDHKEIKVDAYREMKVKVQIKEEGRRIFLFRLTRTFNN